MTIKQRWECPRCGRKYDSPVNLSAISCSRFGTCKAMTLVEGEMPNKPASILPKRAKQSVTSRTNKGK